MTVRDLLTMSGGHDTEPARGDSPTVKQFLAHPVLYKPGTHFLYNTMGSYVLAAIVTEVTGQEAGRFSWYDNQESPPRDGSRPSLIGRGSRQSLGAGPQHWKRNRERTAPA